MGYLSPEFIRIPPPKHPSIRGDGCFTRLALYIVEEWIELAVEGVVEEAVAYGGFMDVAGFWVVHFEVFVAAVGIGASGEVAVEREDVVHQIALEILHVVASAFPSQEFSPCLKEILDRDDIVIGMSELNPLKQPPRLLPVLERAKTAYMLWLIVHRKMARSERFGIGDRIDSLWLDLLDVLRKATYATPAEKIVSLDEALRRVDSVRFFLQIAWESKLMAQSHFISLGKDIEEIGRMVGGWKKGILAKTPMPFGIGERKE